MLKTNFAVFERYFRTMIGKSIYFSMNTMICLPKLEKLHRQTDMEIKGDIL